MSLVYMYIRIPYSAQEDLSEEKPTRTLNCKKDARGQRCLLAKRESLFSHPPSVFFFFYLSTFHSPFIFTSSTIYVFFPFFVFPLYAYILFHLLCRHIVLLLVNGCMSISWPVCREFDGKENTSKKRCIVEITKQYARTFRSIFFIERINIISHNKSDSVFTRLYIYLQTLRYIL